MTRVKSRDKKLQKTIAQKRINKLFYLAEKNAISDNFTLADRYVELARKLSMRYLIPIPNEHKRRFCKHCYSFLLPDANCRVRIHRGRLIIYCHNCEKFTRIPLKKSKS
jgi:ribonuclease P protein subunit RPR2